jgi:hypothetical protein
MPCLQAHGKIMAPVLITKLQNKRPGMQMAVVGFDGLLYVVDGTTGAQLPSVLATFVLPCSEGALKKGGRIVHIVPP